VSERRNPPAVAQDSKQNAETRKDQVHQGSNGRFPTVEDRYALSFPILRQLLTRFC
jgi:hypothetical protein